MVQSLALVALFISWFPDGPSENNLRDLASQYTVLEVGDEDCGNGRPAMCDWEFVIEHDGSEADLARELERVGIKNYRIEEAASGESKVIEYWTGFDPGGWSSLAAFGLFIGICGEFLAALAQLVLKLGRQLPSG